MKLKTLKQAPILIAGCVIGVACGLQVGHFEFFERLERMTYDWRARQALKFPSVTATNLGFVDITDSTIEAVNNGSLGFRYGLYWPRHIYGRVARELKAQGARAVAFDVLFGELRGDHGQLLFEAEDKTVTSDEYFARLTGQAGNVLLAAEQGIVPPPLFRTNALALGDITAEKDSDGVLRRARAYRIYRKWHWAFQQLADDPDYGVDLRKAVVEPKRIILPRSDGDPIIFPLDAQGRFDLADFAGTNLPPRIERHSKPFTEERVWHMGIVLAAQELKLDLAKADVEPERGRLVLHGTGGVKRTIPIDRDGYFYINWCLTDHDPRLTRDYFEHLLAEDNRHFTSATNSAPDDWKWKGKLAIVGSSATGNDLTDRGATPLQKDALLVSKHWNVANSVLTGRFVRRAGLPVSLALIIAMGVISASVTLSRRVIVASSCVLALTVAYTLVSVIIFAKFGCWIPIVLPVCGGLITNHGMLLGYLVIFEQAEQRRVKGVFGKIVSRDVMVELLRSERLSSLDGARRNITILFADIRGFTEMTDVNRERAADRVKREQLIGDAAEAVFDAHAKEALDTVNRYLKTIADVILQYNGTVDKFIGDCVMAFWGAPTTNLHHALHCVQAAIEAQRAVFRLNLEREAENRRRGEENIKRQIEGQPLLEPLPLLAVGTGINTGAVTVGLMGSEEQLNYTAFGREVNVASRLESVSGRSRIIISEATLAEIIQDDADLALSCVELPPEKVKGIREAVRIYEVPWRTGEYASKAASDATQAAATGNTMPPFRAAGFDAGQTARAEKRVNEP